MAFVGSMLIALTLMSPPVAGASQNAGRAAETFGRALTSANVKSMRSVLPEEGKVRLRLVRLGPEDGLFGAAQVEAVFQDFLGEGSVRSFEVVGVESDDRSHGLVHARAVVIDRTGRPGRVNLHLSFEPEAGRWVLREIKETGE